VKLVPIYLKIYANSLAFLNLKSGLIGRAAFLFRPNFFVSYIPEHKYYETYDDAKEGVYVQICHQKAVFSEFI